MPLDQRQAKGALSAPEPGLQLRLGRRNARDGNVGRGAGMGRIRVGAAQGTCHAPGASRRS